MTWKKKHIQETVSYEFCAGDAVATPLVQQLPSLVGFSKRQFWVCNLHVPCNDDGFILKCFWWCLYWGLHSFMLLIFQTWPLTKVSNIWYTCIYDIKIEREREQYYLIRTYIYISRVTEIAVGWTVFAHTSWSPFEKKHSRVASFPGCLHAERCMDKSVRPKMVLVYPNLKTIEMFILKWFGNLRWK